MNPSDDRSTYTFTMNQYNKIETSLTGNAEGIQDVLEDFKMFLLGCGYGEYNVEKIQYLEEEEKNDLI